MTTRQKRSLSQLVSLMTHIVGLTAILLGSALIVQAQDNNTPQRGFHPASSYALTDLETINTVNGNMMFRLPLAALPDGRGRSPGTRVGLFYNSKLYDARTEFRYDYAAGEWFPASILTPSTEGGWRYGFQYQLQLENRRDQYPSGNWPQCQPGSSNEEAYKLFKLKMSFPDGSVREFRPLGYTDFAEDGFFEIRPDGWRQNCIPPNYGSWTYNRLTYYSTDGTYLRLDIEHDDETGNWQNNPWTLYFPDGARVTFNEPGASGQRIYDRNNNFTEIRSVTLPSGNQAHQIVDQLNRVITIEYDAINGRDYISVAGFNGTPLQWTVKWTATYVLKSYYSYESQFLETLNTGHSVIYEINLPTQAGPLAYTFSYSGSPTYPWPNPTYGWGELSSLTLPSGAAATYQYWDDGRDYVPTQWVLDNHPTSKNLTYQREYDGTSTPVTETWQYSAPGIYSGCNCGRVTQPDGGMLTDHITGTSTPASRLVYKTERPDGSVVERIWQQNVPYGMPVPGWGVANAYVKTEFTSVKDSAGTLVKTAIKDFKYDKNGNVTQVAEYDWVAYSSVPRDASGKPTGIPASAVVKRVTVNTYYSPTPDAADTTTDDPDVYHKSTSPRLRNAIESSEVRSDFSTGSALSRTEYFYDNATTTGNLTTQKSWDSTKGAITRPLTAGNSISVTHQYDVYGNRTFTTDPKNVQTQYVYGEIDGPGSATNLYPTDIKTAYLTGVERHTKLSYDLSTGVTKSSQDVNNNVTTRTSYDAFSRPVLVEEADGTPAERQTATQYDDVARRIVIRSDLNAVGDGLLVRVEHYDQLGRIRLRRTLENPSDDVTNETLGIKVQTRYYAGSTPNYPNSYQLVSNPYRAATSGGASSEYTMGWTRTKLDQGGRVVEVQTFGGASLPAPWGGSTSSTGTVTTVYDAEFTTVTDQAGKVRRSQVDGLGRLVRVDEPDANGNLGSKTSPVQPTSYSYSALGNLTQVNQGVQTRTFVYSSLSRLISATNPESGTVTYQYDNNGNLTAKTDGRGITTTLTYDALNRPVSKTYSDGTPRVDYYYDNQALPAGAPVFTPTFSRGRLIGVTYGGGSQGSYFSYDQLGRITLKYQRTGTTNYQIQAGYNKAGAVSSMTYPSGRVVTYNYYGEAGFGAGMQKPAGRLAKFSGNLGDGLQRTYSEQVLYTAAGQLTQEQFVTNTRLYHNRHFTNRGLLYDVRLGTGTGVDGQTAEWTWNRGAIRLFYSSDYTYGNGGVNVNGNVYRVDHFIPDNESASNWAMPIDYYWYDSLNRIEGVTEVSDSYQNGVYQSVSSFSQQYVYDRYGNRTINQTATWGAGINKKDFTVDVSNNRLGVPGGQSGVMSYDAVGNLINDTYTGEGSRSYDAENRMTSAVGSNGSNGYGYDGEGKRVRRILPGQEWWQVYGINGELIAEYLSTQPAVVSKEYGYRNGELLVVVPCDSTVRWMVSDHLGTPRIEADVSGSLSGIRRHDYLPFGEELVVGMGDNSVRTGGRGYGVDCVRQQFTGKERDTESGLDYFGSRYYSSPQGRFTSVDSVKLTPVRMLDPQRFNLYAYVRNNPLIFVDPEGKDVALANDDKEGRRRALLNITKNLTTSEQRNIGVRKNADGKYELYVKDPSKIDPSKASAGYKYLTNLISNHDLNINYTLIGKGDTAKGMDGTVYSQRALATAGDAGGVTAYYGKNAQTGKQDIEIFVAEGGYPYGVKGLTQSGKDVQIANPDYIITAHELFGETFKYTPGNTHLQNNIIDDSDKVIKIENEIRQFHGLPLRSGKDHGYLREQMTVRPR